MSKETTEGLRVGEVAERLALHPTRVVRLIDSGDLAAYRDPRGQLRIRATEVERYAARSRSA